MPSANKGKGKGREARPSRSRNTTPNSSFSAGPTASAPLHSYLDNDVSKLMMTGSTIQYGELLERMGGVGPIPDSKSLELLMEHLKTLSQLAETRGDACNAGIRELSQKRKEVVEEQESAEREGADRVKMKREADDEEEEKVLKGGKLKRRKERGSSSKEERPLTHGAHDVARQDGAETKVEGAASPASKKSKNAASEEASSLSPPLRKSPQPAADDDAEDAGSPGSDDSSDSHQPEPAPAVPQVQVFGPNPLKFDDPTIYHIREVTPDMTDEEKKAIYSVARFPWSDLSHLMAGSPPDRDFSSSKPASQVNANTFLAYIDPYVRPLTEEDIAFLKEKGDRTTPFIMPRRGKKHYTDVWAEDDGLMNVDQPNGDKERLPLNQGRGNIDQVTDETVETDKVSVGPLVSRLYSLLRYEHRALPDETAPNANGSVNGDMANGPMNPDSMDIDHPTGEASNETKPLPSATAFPDSSPNNFKVPAAKLDHAQLDERLKAELRHVGFLGPDDNPDYDAHYDDDIAQRLRLLQSELKKQMIINSARKTRLLDIARERMAYQEYMTIHDDLDSQVQQAYLKRTRTLGKSKKGSQAKHRPGGAGGGSHVVSAAGVGRPAIGDVARTLMDRRKRWRDCIGLVFKDSKTSVPGKNESVFEPSLMAEIEKAEVEGWDEEQD
ncbi:chromatin-remodeling complexes subunit NGG1 [Aspergillus awamori]|uniref:Histone acetyltransferases subunit 3-domain-containing protein n=2 Tax=Aspergillus TaxID=5052 RepID=A0A3F3Q1S2_9EURO|nr:histone acetyltransferases subunit 3-domain-containing protein [Aspergillus welwitschiae]RDH33110.1 histone acetyltransferases subunit 3-domain-containing protein [Aspergillus welwitschiae]GCB26808.1 chromatin-remodeling complexes subunit NGG1 [Aspergillus awamori]GKZ62968.1 transcriptional regulator [Aspergillus niger]